VVYEIKFYQGIVKEFEKFRIKNYFHGRIGQDD